MTLLRPACLPSAAPRWSLPCSCTYTAYASATSPYNVVYRSSTNDSFTAWETDL